MDDKILRLKNDIETFITNSNFNEAFSLAESYIKLYPNDSCGYYYLGYILIQKNLKERALEILKKGLTVDEKDANLNFVFGNLLYSESNTDEALKYFYRAKLFDPSIGFTINYKEDYTNLNVVFAPMEIANQMNTSVEGLKRLGINAKSIKYYPCYLGYKYDHTLNLSSFNDFNTADLETKKLASDLIKENNLFHFYFGTSLTLDYSDLPLIKELGKKVVMQYWGSDVRQYSKAVKFNKYVKVKDWDEDGIKRKLEFISKYVPHCLVDYELAEYVKDFHPNIHYIAPAVDLSKYNFVKNPANPKPIIVHAPTSPEIKGTSYILKAVEDLKQSYDFDFKLIQGVSHEEAIKIYEKADLIRLFDYW